MKTYVKFGLIYLARMATTGSSLAADTAGINPAKTPTNADVPKPVIILGMLNTTSKSKKYCAKNTHRPTTATPIAPPAKHNTTASTKNSINIK